MRKILLGGAVVLIVAGLAVRYGGNYATNMVHDQLSAQKIYFPKDEASGLFPDLKQYAGQQVNSGPKAKAYADKFIARHLQKAGGGKTYAEVSADFQKNPKDQQLAQLRQTLFMGETLRGLLLNAWGWGLIGAIALYASAGIFILAALMLIAALYLATKSRTKKRRR